MIHILVYVHAGLLQILEFSRIRARVSKGDENPVIIVKLTLLNVLIQSYNIHIHLTLQKKIYHEKISSTQAERQSSKIYST